MSFNINLDEIFLIVNFMKMDDMKIDDRMRRVGENEMKGGKINIFNLIFLKFLFNLKFQRKNNKKNRKGNKVIHHQVVRSYHSHNKNISRNRSYILLNKIDHYFNYQKQKNKN